MDRTIFQKQIDFKPEIKNFKKLEFDNVLVGGIGGSAIPARALFFLDPVYPLWLHDDYGSPEKIEGRALAVAISYSGDTAETLSFARKMLERSLPLVVITAGGKLLEMAQKENLPYVLIPSGIQPRDSVVYMLKALLKILHRDDILTEINKFDLNLIPSKGDQLADFFDGYIPIIYSSSPNSVLGYIWKISFNENAKVPSWNNILPELAHNEIQGWISELNGGLSDKLRILMLLDEEDNTEVKHCVKVFTEEMEMRTTLAHVDLPQSKVSKLMSTLVISREVSHEIARRHQINPENVEIIQAFKKRLNA